MKRMTARELRAYQFVITWWILCARYGRRTFLDFRIQRARARYRAACVAESRPLWKAA